jgi:hypothetical protein
MFFKGSRDSVLINLSAKCPTATGGVQNVNFKGRYRCPQQDEARQLIEDAEARIKTDDDVVNALLTGWEGVKDSNDEPIDFDPDNFKEAMNYPPYRAALVEGAMQILFGKEILRQKNSRTRDARG